jgi:hypothetical protein
MKKLFAKLSPLGSQLDEEDIRRAVETEELGEVFELEFDSNEMDFVFEEFDLLELVQVNKRTLTYTWDFGAKSYRFYDVEVVCYQSKDGRIWIDADDTLKFEEF